jgi:hypothetical protein
LQRSDSAITLEVKETVLNLAHSWVARQEIKPQMHPWYYPGGAFQYEIGLFCCFLCRGRVEAGWGVILATPAQACEGFLQVSAVGNGYHLRHFGVCIAGAFANPIFMCWRNGLQIIMHARGCAVKSRSTLYTRTTFRHEQSSCS